jgi:hypothetical protein
LEDAKLTDIPYSLKKFTNLKVWLLVTYSICSWSETL